MATDFSTFRSGVLSAISPHILSTSTIRWEHDTDSGFSRSGSFVYLSILSQRRIGIDEINRNDQGSNLYLPEPTGYRVMSIQARCESLEYDHMENAQRIELALRLPTVISALQDNEISVVRESTGPINTLDMIVDGRRQRSAVLSFELGALFTLTTETTTQGPVESTEQTITVNT